MAYLVLNLSNFVHTKFKFTAVNLAVNLTNFMAVNFSKSTRLNKFRAMENCS